MLKYSPHMTGVVEDPRFPFDHDGDPREGPKVRLKAIGLRAFSKGAVNALQLLRVQARLASRAPGALETFDPAIPIACMPTADALPANA